MSTSLLDPSPVRPEEDSPERFRTVGAPTDERTSTEIGGSDQRPRLPGSRFFGNASIRTKVILITVVPLVAMFVFSGVLARSVLDEAQAANRIQDFARLGNESSSLVDVLQTERSSAAAYVTNPGQSADHPTLKNFTEHARTTDEDLRLFLAQYEQLDDDIAEPISSEYEQVKRGFSALSRNRAAVLSQARQGSGVRVGAAVTIYGQLITSLLQMKERLAAASAGDETLSNQLTAVAAFAKYKEAVWQQQIVVRTALEDGQSQFTNDTFGAFRAAVSDESAYRAQFALSGTPKQQEIRNSTVTQELTYQQLRTRAANAGLGNKLSFTLDTWLETSDRENKLLRSVETQINAITVEAAGDFRSDAMRKAIGVISAALAALIVALLVSLAVARSMIRPLVSLRSSALEVAYQSLPDVVRKLQEADSKTAEQASAETVARTLEVRSSDEIGQVAQAFNAIHLEAVRVASEQARLRQSVSAMFVNLSRRSQLLVDRLIRLIDGLEQGERDPDRLAELFKLDHLATRMRRNDENLLVLGGADSGRSWSKPAPLVDVLRAAAAEVEQYTRVKLGTVDDSVQIASGAVNDTVHLIAEILENATSFSSPRTDVTVDARREGNQVVVEVIDQGIGMSRQQLAEFNERLAKPPVFDIAVSRMMGLFVVGRLASRHGVKVMLRDATGGGVLVMITLPSGVLHGARPKEPDLGLRPVERVVSERVDRPEPLSYVPTGGFGGPTAYQYDEQSGAHSTTFHGTSVPTQAPVPAPAEQPIPRRQPAPVVRAESWNGFQTAAERRASHAAPDAEVVETPPSATSAPATYGAYGARSYGTNVVDATPVEPFEASWAQPTQPLPVRPLPEQPLPTRALSDQPLPTRSLSEQPLHQRSLPEQPLPARPVAQPPALPSRSAFVDGPAPASALAPLPVQALPVQPAPAPPQPVVAPDPTIEMPLPIFEATENDWFRARNLPRVPEAAGAQPTPPAAPPAPRVHVSMNETPLTHHANGTTLVAPPAPAPARPAAPAAPVAPPVASQPSESWKSAADAGWRAAQAAAENQPTSTTTSGLPKRVPMAHYVPGKVERSEAPPATRRSPEAVRGVLSSYRSGLEQGRQAGGPAGTGSKEEM
ncbi:nitrate- and nitrite sensing domain-containing protein [Cryptosporangium sp. NPDC048952]|uniref:sensor histidine kinase n=1 Tax=Cryptosporangium sp. NPDC048952 TaxID=3363961 RepID=UPI003711868A